MGPIARGLPATDGAKGDQGLLNLGWSGCERQRVDRSRLHAMSNHEWTRMSANSRLAEIRQSGWKSLYHSVRRSAARWQRCFHSRQFASIRGQTELIRLSPLAGARSYRNRKTRCGHGSCMIVFARGAVVHAAAIPALPCSQPTGAQRPDPDPHGPRHSLRACIGAERLFPGGNRAHDRGAGGKRKRTFTSVALAEARGNRGNGVQAQVMW